MADLISREAALSKLEERFESHRKRSQRNIGSGFCEVHKEWAAMAMGVAECLDVVRKLPAVDAVEVVRCKDCRWGVESDYYKSNKCTIDAEYDENVGEYIGFVEWHRADFYCAYGERRAEDAI